MSGAAFGDNMALPVHRWFRYSAGFSARWARQVIQDSGARRVLDPFGGSGTTPIAAETAGVAAIGVDLHPFVARVAAAKLAWRAEPDTLLRRASAVLSEADRDRAVAPASSALVARCFQPQSLAELTRLRDSVRRLGEGDAYDELLWLALVSALRVCSPVGTAQWQYVLPGRTKARVARPRTAFRQRADLFAADMRAMAGHAGAPRALFAEGDARSLAAVPDGWADLVVTSPPYANNFDYADATRLEMSFLGEVDTWADLAPLRRKLLMSSSQQVGRWDPGEALASPLLEPIRAELAGVHAALAAVRRDRRGHKAYHSMVVGYFHDSAQVWRALRRVAAPGAQVCYVVGDSAPYGVHVPVERWLGELAVAAGFTAWRFEQLRERNTRWECRKHRVPLREGLLWVDG